MHANVDKYLHSVASGLGYYYLLLWVMNWIVAFGMWRRGGKVLFRIGPVPVLDHILWFLVGSLFFLFSPLAFIGIPISLPAWFMHFVNVIANPTILLTGTFLLMIGAYMARRTLAKPQVAWGLLNLTLFLMGASMTNPSFGAIVGKPDNVPIVGLVFLLGFFTWLAMNKAVANDDRRRRGLGPVEKEDSEKVLVWPDLVYTELICMIALSALLLVWGIALQAPLEEPASSVKTPNPSKAPWYFLGLQEMLVYFDPWYAGVVLPSLVIFGLMAIPFLDFNRQGNGYFTIEERKFSYAVFQVGFLELWVVLIVLGTFLRGPNWNFFGPFEAWDAHKVLVQNNIDLSYIVWVDILGVAMPKAPAGSSGWTQFPFIVWRESPGLIAVAAYFLLGPPILAATVFRRFFAKMGFIRFMIMANLLLLMGTLPIKMVLRWSLTLKYIISIPEYFFNF